MARFFTAIIGFGLTGFGIWLIASEQTKNTACNAAQANVNGASGIGMSSSCLNVTWAYFGGFAILAVGVLTIVITFAMMKRLRKNRGGYKERAPGPHVGKPS
ncbi:MAG: hypothetical protein WA786_09440 [Acidimicrobiales bacterium]